MHAYLQSTAVVLGPRRCLFTTVLVGTSGQSVVEVHLFVGPNEGLSVGRVVGGIYPTRFL